MLRGRRWAVVADHCCQSGGGGGDASTSYVMRPLRKGLLPPQVYLTLGGVGGGRLRKTSDTGPGSTTAPRMLEYELTWPSSASLEESDLASVSRVVRVTNAQFSPVAFRLSTSLDAAVKEAKGDEQWDLMLDYPLIERPAIPGREKACVVPGGSSVDVIIPLSKMKRGDKFLHAASPGGVFPLDDAGVSTVEPWKSTGKFIIGFSICPVLTDGDDSRVVVGKDVSEWHLIHNRQSDSE